MVVSNIIKARGVERRQEVILEMSRKPLPVVAKEVDNPEALFHLKAENQELKVAIHTLKEELTELASLARKN